MNQFNHERYNSMIPLYYCFQNLPDEVKKANGIRSKSRLDCIRFTDNVPGGYQGMMFFVNSKRQLSFYLTPVRSFANADTKRLAEWSLTNNSLNLSSIYIEDLDFPQYGFGYQNANTHLNNGTLNPMRKFCFDAFLFIINEDYTRIEVLVIPDGRNLITAYYHRLIDGELDEILQNLRHQAKPYFNYQMGGTLL